MKANILDEIDIVLGCSLADEYETRSLLVGAPIPRSLDEMLDVVFTGQNGTDSCHEGFAASVHNEACRWEHATEVQCETNTHQAFTSWFQHPIHNVWEYALQNNNAKNSLYCLRREILVLEDDELDYVIRDKHLIIGWLEYCIRAIEEGAQPLQFSVWLFLEENPDFTEEAGAVSVISSW
jgi:hypothetical protein